MASHGDVNLRLLRYLGRPRCVAGQRLSLSLSLSLSLPRSLSRSLSLSLCLIPFLSICTLPQGYSALDRHAARPHSSRAQHTCCVFTSVRFSFAAIRPPLEFNFQGIEDFGDPQYRADPAKCSPGLPSGRSLQVFSVCNQSAKKQWSHLEMVGNSNRDSEFSSEKLTDSLQTESIREDTVI